VGKGNGKGRSVDCRKSKSTADGADNACARMPLRFCPFVVVIDFEATCQEGSVIYPQEIIEFPSVLVDGATGRTLSTFRTYVRPRHHPRLTDFCRDLTGITQGDVDAGVSLAEALEMHDHWLEAHGAKLGKLAVVTWGDWDCRTMPEGECRFKSKHLVLATSVSLYRMLFGRRGCSGRAASIVVWMML